MIINPILRVAILALVSFSCPALLSSPPRLPEIGAAMDRMIAQDEIAGAVTIVLSPDRILHVGANGYANMAAKTPIAPDSLFWIASMTKPITGVAVMMLQDEGKLNIADPVAKYLPEFAQLKTPSGKPAHLTLIQLLTHTSGLGEAGGEAARNARTLADLVPIWLAAPMQYEPGEKWKYTQSGINLAGRVVEIVSGVPFDVFLQKRLFDPLGMKDTTFYPTDKQKERLATGYTKNKDTGRLEPAPVRTEFGARHHPPQGNGGLYSTPNDYARFCQMLLNRGSLQGRRYLSATAFATMTSVQTSDLECGFFREKFGKNYGWGIGTCVLRTPHAGAAESLSPGSFGHGGAWGTQAWIDPIKGVAYLLMVQWSNFPNSDASEVRRCFQEAALGAIATGR